MGKIIIHKLTNEELIDKRQLEFLKLSYAARFKKAIQLIKVSLLFSKENKLHYRNKIIVKS